MKAAIEIELWRVGGNDILKRHKESIRAKAFRHAAGLVDEGYREGEIFFQATTDRKYLVRGWWKLTE